MTPTKEELAVGKVYEICRVTQDILYEAERGKITWLEALEQLKQEHRNAKV